MNRQASFFSILLLALLFGFAARPAARAPSGATTVPQSASTARFSYGGNAAEVPAEFLESLIFLPVRVNNGPPSSFELDSHADVSSMDPGRVSELGLKMAILQNLVLGLPGVEIPMPSLALAAKDNFAARVGRSYQGTLGNDFFSRVIIEVDYSRKTVRIFDPGSYSYSGKGISFPLFFDGTMPRIRAKFSLPKQKTQEADFYVNTTIDDAIVFSDRYATAHHLFSSHIRTIPDIDSEQNGGGLAVLGRLTQFEIGKYVVREPVAVFSQADSAASGDSTMAGSIGGGLLRRFTVVFDFPHHSLILAPNPHFIDDDEAAMSGLSLIAKGPGLKTFEIAEVEPHTPAGDAGLQKGDIIAGINDEAAADLSLLEIRQMFRQLKQKYKLVIERGEKTLTVTIQMRRLI